MNHWIGETLRLERELEKFMTVSVTQGATEFRRIQNKSDVRLANVTSAQDRDFGGNLTTPLGKAL